MWRDISVDVDSDAVTVAQSVSESARAIRGALSALAL
jgi:hypothetical protein